MEDTITNDQALDKVRAYRMFTGLASAALGVYPEGNYAHEDAWIGNTTGQGITADPYRGAAYTGTSQRVTNGTQASAGGLYIPPVLILLGLGLWAMHRKG